VEAGDRAPIPWTAQRLAQEEEGAGSADFGRYLAGLVRYKWLIVAVTVLGTAGSAVASRFVKPTYRAQASVWIEASVQVEVTQQPIKPSRLLDQAGWVQLVTEPVVLDPVVRNLRLFLTSESQDQAVLSTLSVAERYRTGEYRLEVGPDRRTFTLRDRRGGNVWDQGRVGDSIGRPVGLQWLPPDSTLQPGRRVDFTVVMPREAGIQLATDLVPKMDRNGNFLIIQYSGTNPRRTAAILDAIITQYVDVAQSLKRDKLTELTRELTRQLEYAQANMVRAETALEGFQIRTITLPTQQGTPVTPGLAQTENTVMSNYFNLKIQQDQIRRDRDALERALAGDSLSTSALMVIQSVNGSPLATTVGEYNNKQMELRTLRRRYTDENPQVQAVARDVDLLYRETLPSMVRALMQDLTLRERSLATQIAAAGGELEEIPARTIEETRLQRELQSASSLYTNLRSRLDAARLAEATTLPDVQILSRPVVPRKPVSNTMWRIILTGAAISLGLGVGLAFLLDRLDRRLRYPEQVSEELGLPILGAVPHVDANGRKGALRGPEALTVVESLRGIRLGLTHAYGAAGPMMVTITSPGPGDGKSFVTANLALAFAEAGHRTVVIDADVRRGELHRVLGTSRKPGLTDFLLGKAGRDDVVQHTRYESLDFVGGGTRMQAAPELLGSPAMLQLLMSLRSAYTVILLDSSPLGAGIDPLVLGTASGSLLVVLRSGVTDRELAEAKLDALDRLPIRVLGAVLNDIRPGGYNRYYHYQYYTPGYETRDESAETADEDRAALPKAAG
jgi:capsular exopolysaccharide synthesis family protein